MMKNFKRGQAALEFLTTYGWAFLVILVAIGALSYFGVFDMGNLVPKRCSVDAEFNCPDYQIVKSQNVSIILQSAAGQSIKNISNANASIGGSTSVAPCDDITTVSASGSDITVTCDLSTISNDMPAVGDDATITIKGDYYVVGQTFKKQFEAEVFATVQ